MREMQSTLNSFAVLNLMGAIQGLLLALALVTIKRGNRTANLLLAAFAAMVSVLVTWTLPTQRYVSLMPHLLRVNHPFDFAAGPLLYLYVRALTSRRPKLKKSDLLHFIPLGLCVLYLIPYYRQSGEFKLNQYYSGANAQWYYLRVSLAIPQALVYLILGGIRIVRYRHEIKDRESPAERAVLFQIRFFVLSFSALWLAALLRYVFDLRYPAYRPYTNVILPLGATIILYMMAYFGLRRPETLVGADEPLPAEKPEAEKPEVPPAKKYEKSTLTLERSDFYLKKLLAVMETEKPYTDHDLSLSKLAANLSLPTHHLSQIINERLNQNFFDFINSYRVEEAKRKLLDPAKKHYSLLVIAEEVGFNSKSAFNTAFKKQTNLTPSEFRKLSRDSSVGEGADQSPSSSVN